MKKFNLLISVICIIALAVIPMNLRVRAPEVFAEDVDAITRLYSMDIVEGYEDGMLHGEWSLTRAQFAKILNSAFPPENLKEKIFKFTDLDESHWAYEDIQKAANAGRFEGYDDETFRPDDNITYEQAITIVCRVLGISDYCNNYPEDYISIGIENCLTDKVNALIGEQINREMASQIILNSLDYREREGFEEEYDNAMGLWFSGGGVAKSSVAPTGAMKAPEAEAAMDGEYLIPMESPEIPYVPMNTEEYTAVAENVFKDTITSPLSTFSIDTDTASYSNMRRFILNGQKIANGSVRSEELINYFDYSRAQIEDGKPFGVDYTVASCPWNSEHNIAMITVSGEELREAKPSNIVFLIDTSGSMYSVNKLPLVKQSLSMLLQNLGENDRISIVTYASGTGVALESTPATEKEKILDAIGQLSAGGATAGASGINLAYEQAEKNKIDGNNRIILCTDGDFNVGISSEGDLEELISQKRESGIYLSVLGFGMGNYKDNKMETLADKGNGNYAYIDNLKEAKKVLVDEMAKTIYTIAKDVKLQVEFNPEKVGKYRLIGYENRTLNNEDFDNDAKDAGELGAGATVTVLYEIIPFDGNRDTVLKYQTGITDGSDELMTVKIRYKLPESDESTLCEYPLSSDINPTPGDDFRFACAVAELGMLLNKSEYKGNSTYDSVIELARSSLGEDRFGIRNEFVQLVDLLRYK